MRFIQSVTIPRSGHHLLVNCLKNYFDNFRYCSYYDCCMETPCPKGCDFQKNHDFGIHDSRRKLPELPIQGPAIIQYRWSAQGTFNSMFRNTYLKGLLGKDMNWWWNRPADYMKYFEGDGIFESYRKFINKWKPYYKYFEKKWLTGEHHSSLYFLEYYDFIEHPAFHLRKIITMFGESPNESKINKTIKDQKIILKHELEMDPLFREDFNEMFKVNDLPFLCGHQK